MRKTVLIVDDMATNLLQAKNALQGSYAALTVSDAEKMFAFLEKKRPSLILLDIEMPEMDGFEAMEKLKSSPRFAGIPVIFCTARVDPEVEKKGYELGALDFIKKPFTSEDLLERVKIKIDV